MRRYALLNEAGRPVAIAEAKRPAAGSAAPASTAGLPVVRVGRQEIRTVTTPGGTTELTEVTPLGERLPVWKPAPRPTPKPSNEPREVELREPGNAEGSLRDALRRLGVNASAADSAAGGHD